MLKFVGLSFRCWIPLAMLGAALLSTSACQYAGSFEGKRCSQQSDCPGTTECVEGYCLAEPVEEDVDPRVASVQLTPESLEVTEGDVVELSISALDEQGSQVDSTELQWESTDEAIASVDESGVITALAAGTTLITASADGSFDSTRVVVSPVEVSTIAVDPTSLELKPGDTAQLTARVLDEDGEELAGREIRWSSDAPGTAFVDESGEVTAVRPGSTTITLASGGVEQTVAVEVLEADLASVELTPSTLTLDQGDDFMLRATVRDEFGVIVENAPLTFASSDDTVATVDAAGLVSAVAEGSAIITAVSGTAQATADITVEPMPVASIELSPISATLETGASVQLDARALAADASELTWPAMTFTSSNDAVASVDAAGLVTAHQTGTVAITAQAGGVEKNAAIAVIARQATGLSISPGDADIEVGLRIDLDATVQDVNGTTIANPFVVWESSDTNVALVDATGEVFGVGIGSATITARTENGTQATATVDVAERSADSIDLRPQSASIEQTQTLALDATVRASDQSILEGRTVTFASSDDSVASVDANGVVTGVAPGGPVTITATSDGASESVDVTVVARTVTGVEVSPQLTTIEVDAVTTLSASPRAIDGSALSGRTVTWTSDDDTIATVDASGDVTGQAPGVTLVRATIEGVVGYASVRVEPKPVASVEIVEGDQSIAKGSSFDFNATTRSAGGAILSGRAVSWSSDDPTVAVVDSSGTVTGVSGGQANITATSGTVSDTVNVSVTSNAAPAANPQTLATDEDTALAITLSGDDPENDALTVAVTNLPTNGSLSGLDPATGAVTYTPDPDFAGSDSFAFSVTDTSGASAQASVSLTVDAVNDAPLAADDATSTDEESPVTVDVVANDADVEGDALTVTIDTPPLEGTAVVNADETITYTPNADFAGTDRLVYVVSDGTDTDTASVQITVDALNDLPVANDDAATTDEDQSVTLNVLLNDTDIDGDLLSVVSTTSPASGSVTINADGTLTYTPQADFFGDDAFFYEVSDGTASATASVDISVAGVNDAPVASADTATVLEDGSVDIDVVTNDTDVDADPLSVATIDLAPAHGTAVDNADGTITYTPDANFFGTDVFIYTVSDGAGGFDMTYVEVTVTSDNDAPVADAGADQTVNQNDTVQLDGSASADVEGDTLTYSWVVLNEPAGPGITLADPTSATPSFVADRTGTFELELTVSDGTLTHSDTVTITSQ